VPTHRFPFIVPPENFLIADDCLVRANRRELIRYLGSSQTLHVSREITVIDAGSFSKCCWLTALNFEHPSHVTHFLHGSFNSCCGLRFIEIPNSVRFIGEDCFENCSELTEVAFESPATVQRIESCAFFFCRRLTSFTVPSSVSALGEHLFDECKRLSSVTFDTPSQVTNVPDDFLRGCRCLTTLILPDSVTNISGTAFAKSGVTSIVGSDWTMSDGLVMRLGKLFCCLGKPSSIRIPGTVREIPDRACFGLDSNSLIDLSFEEGILKIGVSAFQECRKLHIAAFPASLTVIEAKAFAISNQLIEITFAVGSQLQYIRSKAFSYCPLREVVIPANIVEIDPSAFPDDV
jgi:hypothetical protein